jgi:parvulin-like peptidyl-prolyl isomerase
MAEKVLLKLGGSVITHKGGDCAADGGRLRTIARAIADHPGMRYVIVHGAGSCGHPEARRYHLDRGLSAATVPGIYATHQAVSTLNDAVVQALRGEGIEFSAWKDQWRERRKQERLISEEVGPKIKVDNPQIMEYYRQHAEQYTIPAEFTLNGIFIAKGGDVGKAREKMEQVNAELKPELFEQVAKQYSELPDAPSGSSMGKFKKGELDKVLEEAALKLKKGEVSGWLETEQGWYIVQLADFSAERLQEVKDVREEITQKLREEQQQAKLQEYVAQLRKDSYVKIVKEYR